MPAQTTAASRITLEEFTDVVNRSVARAVASKELKPILDDGRLWPWIFVGIIWRWERPGELGAGQVGGR